ncbi:MAG TPA: hypothetical protein VFV34_02030 [Blastocatellia bacterium]|nr:hypothetical protein [Blastocatellia bacterium]
MAKDAASPTSGSFLVAALSVATLIGLVTPAPSQQPRPSNLPDRADSPRDRVRQMDRRETQLRNIGAQPYRTTDTSTAPAVAQVKQDFERILVIHNEIVTVLLEGADLDYKLISGRTADIKKRATRLQSNLALGDDDGKRIDEKPFEPDDATLKESLVTLCKRIKSFVTNPMIETAGTVEVEQMAQARRDLAAIISLSASISRSAQKLSKTQKRP